jgi:hypothetical protein
MDLRLFDKEIITDTKQNKKQKEEEEKENTKSR